MNLGIVIPTRNSGATLLATLNSLRELRTLGARVLVADSSSTDETLDHAQTFADQVIQVPQGNMYAAVNAGLRLLDTSWMTYINSDDMLFADAVVRAVEAGERGADVVYGCVEYIDAAGRFLHWWRSPPPEDLLPLLAGRVMPIGQAGTVFRREVFEKLGGFDERYKLAADYDFFSRAVLAGFRFEACLGKSVAAFRVHSAQASRNRLAEMLAEGRDSRLRNKPACGRLRRWKALAAWRLRNLDSYLIRILRHWQFSGRWRLSSTLTAPQ